MIKSYAVDIYKIRILINVHVIANNTALTCFDVAYIGIEKEIRTCDKYDLKVTLQFNTKPYLNVK